MPRLDVNRSGEMEVFVQVHDRGGFSAAARSFGMTPSAVSKLVARLEARLGVRLFHRSTRKLQLTTEGQQFYERARRVLADLDDAEQGAAAHALPRGRVTVNSSVSFGTHLLVPLVGPLLARHPGIELDLVLTDRVVDLLDERADIAIRWGPLPPSDLLARRLGQTRQAVVASPAYLARQGTPRRPSDLANHVKLDFTYPRRVPDWPFVVNGEAVDVPVRGTVRASDGQLLHHLALAGVGLVRLSRYQTQRDIDAGRLVPVLERYNPGDVAPIHAVYLGKVNRLPARVRAVIDFFAEALAKDDRLNQNQAQTARSQRGA